MDSLVLCLEEFFHFLRLSRQARAPSGKVNHAGTPGGYARRDDVDTTRVATIDRRRTTARGGRPDLLLPLPYATDPAVVIPSVSTTCGGIVTRPCHPAAGTRPAYGMPHTPVVESVAHVLRLHAFESWTA